MLYDHKIGLLKTVNFAHQTVPRICVFSKKLIFVFSSVCLLVILFIFAFLFCSLLVLFLVMLCMLASNCTRSLLHFNFFFFVQLYFAPTSYADL